MQMSMLIR